MNLDKAHYFDKEAFSLCFDLCSLNNLDKNYIMLKVGGEITPDMKACPLNCMQKVHASYTLIDNAIMVFFKLKFRTNNLIKPGLISCKY